MIYLTIHQLGGSQYEAADHQELIGPFSDRETAKKYIDKHER